MLAEPQLLPGDRGAENCARCPPLPPRRCHRGEQRRQSRVGRAGSAPSPRARRAALPPPAAQARPEAAARAGRAPRAARDAAFLPPRTPHLPRAGDSTPPLWGADCNLAVARATRVAARERERSGARTAPPAPPPPGLTCAPRRNRNGEPSRDPTGRDAGRALHPQVWWYKPRASSSLPALGGTHAPHLPRLFPSHHLCPAVPRASSFQYPAPVAGFLQLSLPELLGALFLPPHPVLPTAPTPRTPKQPTPPSGPHLWLCGKSAAFGAGPGFAPPLSQVT